MNPKLAVRSQAGHDRVKSYRVIDDYTVAFTLKERFVPYLIAWQAMSPIPEHIFAKEADINTSRYNTEPVGSGPFRFVERKAGDYIRLEAFDKYFGDGPYLREYIYKYIPDLTVLYTRWKIGEIQVVGIQGIPADRVQEAQHLPGHKVYLTPSRLWNSSTSISASQCFRIAVFVRRSTWRSTRTPGSTKCTTGSISGPSHTFRRTTGPTTGS